MRLSYLDNITGLLIIYMIYTHACHTAGVSGTDLNRLIDNYWIFMPWFFFKGGLFYKEQPFIAYIKKNWSRLLLPFLKFSIVGHVLYCTYIGVIQGINPEIIFVAPIKELVISGSVKGNLPLWFLSTFFMVHVIYNTLFPLLRCKGSSFILLSIFTVLCILWYHYGVSMPLYIGNILSGLIFFSMGHVMKDYIFETTSSDTLWNKKTCIYIISILLLFIHLFFYPSNVDMHNNIVTIGDYHLWIIYAVAICVSYIFLFKQIPLDLRALSFVGKESMTFYVYHWILFCFIRILLVAFHINITQNLMVLILMVSSLLLVIIAKSKIKA